MLDKEEKLGQRKSGKIKVREEQKGTGKEEGGKPDPEAGQPAPRLPPAGERLRPWMQQELLQEFGEWAPSPGPAPNLAMSPASHVLVYLGLCLSICRTKASGCRKAPFPPKMSLSHQTKGCVWGWPPLPAHPASTAGAP